MIHSGIFVVVALVEFGLVLFLTVKVRDDGRRMRAAWLYARAIKIRTPKGDKEIRELASLLQETLDTPPKHV